MAHAGLVPRGIAYAHDAALKAYDDQMRWIDALDTKAGILMAADGVIAGLILTKDSVLLRAHTLVGVAAALLLFLSLVLSLVAFGTRRYEVAPSIDDLAAQMHYSDDLALRWIALRGVVNAINVNDYKLEQKAAFLFYSGVCLLACLLIFGAYFVYFLI